MPYQIKNGIVYGSNAVSLTQAQYDALSTAEKNNGTVYYIYDSDAVLDASDVGIDGGGNLQDLVGSVATIETSPATATHAVGDYIVYNGQLYEVTAAIAVGETLTVGTNITATTVGDELTSLNNGLIHMLYGEAVMSNISGNSAGTASIDFDTPLSSDEYALLVSIYRGSAGWANAAVRTTNKSATGFNVYAWNNGSSTIDTLSVQWLVLYYA